MSKKRKILYHNINLLCKWKFDSWSLLTSIYTDSLVRWNKQHRKDIFFLTRSDEHCAKVSEKAGLSPKVFCDELVKNFYELWGI